VPLLNELADKPFDADMTYSDVVHFVHINVIEPHPRSPDPSPYGARVWEGENSTVNQPQTYAGRVDVAREIEPLLTGKQLLFVDDLSPGALNNPVWCTYGPAPNSAYLIRQDGIIEFSQEWLDVGEMEREIDQLLK